MVDRKVQLEPRHPWYIMIYSIQKNIEGISHSTEQTVSSIWDRILPKGETGQQEILKKLEMMEKRLDVLEDKLSRLQ